MISREYPSYTFAFAPLPVFVSRLKNGIACRFRSVRGSGTSPAARLDLPPCDQFLSAFQKQQKP